MFTGYAWMALCAYIVAPENFMYAIPAGFPDEQTAPLLWQESSVPVAAASGNQSARDAWIYGFGAAAHVAIQWHDTGTWMCLLPRATFVIKNSPGVWARCGLEARMMNLRRSSMRDHICTGRENHSCSTEGAQERRRIILAESI